MALTMAMLAATALMAAAEGWAGDEKKPEGVPAKAAVDAEAAKKRVLAEELVSLMREDFVAAYAGAFTTDELLRMIETCKYPTEGRHAEERPGLSAKLIQSIEKKMATEKSAEPAKQPTERKAAAQHLDETTKKLESATRKLDELDAAAEKKADGK